jgi:hypothetical protein
VKALLWLAKDFLEESHSLSSIVYRLINREKGVRNRSSFI